MTSVPDRDGDECANGVHNVAVRAIARESDDAEPRRNDPLSAIEVTGPDGPAVALGPTQAGQVTIGLHIAGNGAFMLVEEADLVAVEEVR